MLDLIKYVVEQFAEDKANIKYEVEETDEAINVSPIRIWARSSANRARSPRRSAPSSAPLPPRTPKSTPSRSKNVRRNNAPTQTRAADFCGAGFFVRPNTPYPCLQGKSYAVSDMAVRTHMPIRTWVRERPCKKRGGAYAPPHISSKARCFRSGLLNNQEVLEYYTI